MVGADSARAGFEEFVEVRSGHLLRTAYQLTHDPGPAEDLLQAALTRAWFAWPRLDAQPEPYVRRVMVSTYVTWWRRRRWVEQPPERVAPVDPGTRPDLWLALGRLPRRQRAVVVLRCFEDLSEVATADLLGCAVGTVRSRTSTALAGLRVDPDRSPSAASGDVVGIQDLLETLHERSADVAGPGTHRVGEVVERVARVSRRRRTAATAGAVLGVLVVAGGALVRSVEAGPAPVPPAVIRTPDPAPPGSPGPARVGGWTYPGTLVVGGRRYGRGSSSTTDPGERRLSLTVGSASTPRVLAWSTSSGTQGVTTLAVDGSPVSRSPAGSLESGLVLAPGRGHTVVVRAGNLGPRQVIVLTTYDALGR